MTPFDLSRLHALIALQEHDRCVLGSFLSGLERDEFEELAVERLEELGSYGLTATEADEVDKLNALLG